MKRVIFEELSAKIISHSVILHDQMMKATGVN